MKIILTFVVAASFLFSNSLQTLVDEAKKGSVKAIFKLGYIYENGIEVKKDLNKAYKFYKKAASMGDEDALVALSLFELNNKSSSNKNLSNKVLIKDNSNFLKIENSELKELIEKAKNNDKEALFTLASLYESGFNNIASDSKKAKLLYKKAAKLGSKKAQEVLLKLK